MQKEHKLYEDALKQSYLILERFAGKIDPSVFIPKTKAKSTFDNRLSDIVALAQKHDGDMCDSDYGSSDTEDLVGFRKALRQSLKVAGVVDACGHVRTEEEWESRMQRISQLRPASPVRSPSRESPFSDEATRLLSLNEQYERVRAAEKREALKLRLRRNVRSRRAIQRASRYVQDIHEIPLVQATTAVLLRWFAYQAHVFCVDLDSIRQQSIVEISKKDRRGKKDSVPHSSLPPQLPPLRLTDEYAVTLIELLAWTMKYRTLPLSAPTQSAGVETSKRGRNRTSHNNLKSLSVEFFTHMRRSWKALRDFFFAIETTADDNPMIDERFVTLFVGLRHKLKIDPDDDDDDDDSGGGDSDDDDGDGDG
eukprot:Rmarinus@m.20052